MGEFLTDPEVQKVAPLSKEARGIFIPSGIHEFVDDHPHFGKKKTMFSGTILVTDEGEGRGGTRILRTLPHEAERLGLEEESTRFIRLKRNRYDVEGQTDFGENWCFPRAFGLDYVYNPDQRDRPRHLRDIVALKVGPSTDREHIEEIMGKVLKQTFRLSQ